MYYLKLIYKNIFRHKLRSLLTIAGLVVAILSFGLLQTVVHAWYAGADMASANRLITRNATSLVFSLPAYYRERIRALDGVTVQGPVVQEFLRDFRRRPRQFLRPLPRVQGESRRAPRLQEGPPGRDGGAADR